MKKEINALLESNNSTLKINDFCTLRRWTCDAIGNEVDRLEACFDLLHVASHTYEISARDWLGVVNEVLAYQTKAFESAAELNRQLANGYIG